MAIEIPDPYIAFYNFLMEFKDSNGNNKYHELIERLIEEGLKSIKINFKDLQKFDKELAHLLITNPEKYLDDANYVLTFILSNDKNKRFLISKYFCRFYNIPKENHFEIKELSSLLEGKLISTSGFIQKISDLGLLLKEGFFQCTRCNEIMIRTQRLYEYTLPNQCENPGCGTTNQKYFSLIKEESKYVDFQEGVLLNWPRCEGWKKTENKLEIIIQNDLVDKFKEKDIVNVTGYLHFISKPRRKDFLKRFVINNIESVET